MNLVRESHYTVEFWRRVLATAIDMTVFLSLSLPWLAAGNYWELWLLVSIVWAGACSLIALLRKDPSLAAMAGVLLIAAVGNLALAAVWKQTEFFTAVTFAAGSTVAALVVTSGVCRSTLGSRALNFGWVSRDGGHLSLVRGALRGAVSALPILVSTLLYAVFAILMLSTGLVFHDERGGIFQFTAENHAFFLGMALVPLLALVIAVGFTLPAAYGRGSVLDFIAGVRPLRRAGH